MSIKAGQLDRRLTILRKEVERTKSGAYSEQPEEVAAVWGKKVLQRGREFFAHGETQNDQRAEFLIRYRSDITTQMFVRDDEGKEYDIESVSDEFMRQGELHLFCLLRQA